MGSDGRLAPSYTTLAMPPFWKAIWDSQGDLRQRIGLHHREPREGSGGTGPLRAWRGHYVCPNHSLRWRLWLMGSPRALHTEGWGGGSTGPGVQDLISSPSSAPC